MSDPLATFSSTSSTQQKQSGLLEALGEGADTSLAARWSSLFRGTSSSQIDTLRARGIEGKIAQHDDASLRWLQWKLFLTEDISSIPSSWYAVLERDRDAYNELRCRLLRAPDGNYPPEVGFDGTPTPLRSTKASPSTRRPSQPTSAVVHDLSVNNPLSLDDSNPWKTYYSTLEVRRIILQDVERTFPDLDVFRLVSVQQSLTNILFLWALQNEDVGYRQGMHELAAVLWKVRSNGAVDAGVSSHASAQASIDAPFQHALADDFIEHDVYGLFCVLMKSAKNWYAWRESPSIETVSALPNANPLGSPIKPAKSTAEPSRRPLPIVVKCETIFDHLRHLDPALAQHLQSLAIEPQLFCLRWIRMIFTREFCLDDAIAIWDGLFATGGSLSLIDYVCIAMLLRIRNQLLSGDHSSALQCLLKYPAEAQIQPSLLVKQAVYLRGNVRQPSTGVAVVMQNRDLLGIRMRSPDDASPAAPHSRQRPTSPSQRFGAQKFATVGRASSSPANKSSPWMRFQDDSVARIAHAGSQHARPDPVRRPAPKVTADPLGALPEPISNADANGSRPFGINPSAYLPEGISDLAKGWYERAELPQTLNSALANVSKTVAAAAAAGVAGAYGSNKAEESGFPSGFDQAFSNQGRPRASVSAATLGRSTSSRNIRPSMSNAGVTEGLGSAQQTPSTSPSKTSSENFADPILKLTTANKAIGSALSVCIDVLEQSWLDRTISGDNKDQARELEQRDVNTLMSFTALKHIRDVLNGTASEFDPATLPAPGPKQAAKPAGSREERSTGEQRDLQDQGPTAALLPRSEVRNTIANGEPMASHSALPMSLPEYARYGRQMILPDFGLPGQLRLRGAKVLIVGAGGLGCPALQYLAAAGVGQISILDHDIVEPSNLARQILHSDATVGMHKAVSAAKAAMQINPYITAVPLSEALSAANARQLMRGQDLVLDCTDNPLTRYLISDAAVLEGVQVVSGAAQGYDGQLVVLHKRIKPEFAGPKASAAAPGSLVRGPCYRCLFPKAPRPEEVTNCEDGGVLGGITGLVGTMQALEAVKILAGIGEETPPLLTLVSPLTSTPFRSVKIRPRRVATCRSCGDPTQVTEPMITDLETEDYVSFCGLAQAAPGETGRLPRTAVAAMDPKALVVDVRPPVEYGITKLDGSLNLPIQRLLKDPKHAWETIQEAKQNASAPSVLVVCKKGNDSQLAATALLQHQKELGEQQKKQAQQAAVLPNSPSHPLDIAAATPDAGAATARSPSVAAMQITDLIGGLRAYSKEKDPNFPIY